MFSSPGIPNTTETPSDSRHLTINCAAVVISGPLRRRMDVAAPPDRPLKCYGQENFLPAGSDSPAFACRYLRGAKARRSEMERHSNGRLIGAAGPDDYSP